MPDEREERPRMDLRKKLEVLEGPVYGAHRKDDEHKGIYAVLALKEYYQGIMGEFYDIDTNLQASLARAEFGYKTGGRGMSDAGILELLGSLSKAYNQILTEEIKLGDAYDYLSSCGVKVPDELKQIYNKYSDKTLKEVDNEDDKKKIEKSIGAFMSHKFTIRDVSMSRKMVEDTLESLVRGGEAEGEQND